jgi:hypothetical protein
MLRAGAERRRASARLRSKIKLGNIHPAEMGSIRPAATTTERGMRCVLSFHLIFPDALLARKFIRVATEWLHLGTSKEKALSGSTTKCLIHDAHSWLLDLGSKQGPTD